MQNMQYPTFYVMIISFSKGWITLQIDAKSLIKKYGQPITITQNGKITKSYAFIQPLRADDQSNLYGDYNDLSTEQYLYIGLPDRQIDDSGNTVITLKNENYSVIKAESVLLSNKVIYNRAVLEKQ